MFYVFTASSRVERFKHIFIKSVHAIVAHPTQEKTHNTHRPTTNVHRRSLIIHTAKTLVSPTESLLNVRSRNRVFRSFFFTNTKLCPKTDFEIQ